jgi:CheY-like chemotaxis protein
MGYCEKSIKKRRNVILLAVPADPMRNFCGQAQLYFPAKKGAALTNNSQPMESASRQSAPFVLVVEDEFLVRLMAAQALREVGCEVVEAINGAEAIAFIQSGAPVDLIFTDIQMPGPVDGLGLLAFAQQTIPDVPVIVSSGHLDPNLALESGAAAFLPKPYQTDDLAMLIDVNLGARFDRRCE